VATTLAAAMRITAIIIITDIVVTMNEHPDRGKVLLGTASVGSSGLTNFFTELA
jgi:hypothetical protein